MKIDHWISVVLMVVIVGLGWAVYAAGDGPLMLALAKGQSDTAPQHTQGDVLLVISFMLVGLLLFVWGAVQTIVGMVQTMTRD